jgi:hypothetical protein
MKRLLRALSSLTMTVILLTTFANCSKDDSQTEETTKRVSIAATIDAVYETRAAIGNVDVNGRRVVSFSEGDILFVWGSYSTSSNGTFHGSLKLTGASGGNTATFTGDIVDEGKGFTSLENTIELYARLLPATWHNDGSFKEINNRIGVGIPQPEATLHDAFSKYALISGQYNEETKRVDLKTSSSVTHITLNGLTPQATYTVQSMKKGDTPEITATYNVQTDANGKVELYLSQQAFGQYKYVFFNTRDASDTYVIDRYGTYTLPGCVYDLNLARRQTEGIDLMTVNGPYTATDGQVVYTTMTSHNHLIIADGATVTLDGVSIDPDSKMAGIVCQGSATIILAEGSVNDIRSKGMDPAILAGPKGSTLIIKGNGTLYAEGGNRSPGIGIGDRNAINNPTAAYTACGNIIIEGGSITSVGMSYAAGIGTGPEATCGNIVIRGGEVYASNVASAACLGTGFNGKCGNIVITNDIKSLTLHKGAYSCDFMGRNTSSKTSTSGTITLGTTVVYDGEKWLTKLPNGAVVGGLKINLSKKSDTEDYLELAP